MPDVLQHQAYGLAETGRLLRVPGNTVRRWARGWQSNGRAQAPMVAARDGRLSFQDLAEITVVTQLRLRGFHLSAIRNAAAEIRRACNVERPFLQGVLVDEHAREIFWGRMDDEKRRIFSTTHPGQGAMSRVVNEELIKAERVVLDDDGMAVRVLPFSRPVQDDPSLISTDPQMIAIDPRYRFGRPVTNPSLIDIDGIALRVRWGESLEEVANELEPVAGIAELEEGLRYWFATLTPAMFGRVAQYEQPRFAAFMQGESVEQIARRVRVREQTVVGHIRKALEHAVAA